MSIDNIKAQKKIDKIDKIDLIGEKNTLKKQLKPCTTKRAAQAKHASSHSH